MPKMSGARLFAEVMHGYGVTHVFYVPTISITNSVAFASMKDAQEEFGIVRMGGTIGWIAAASCFSCAAIFS